MRTTMRHIASAVLILSVSAIVAPFLFAHAETADELRAQIDANSAQLDKINKEIALYESQLKLVSSNKKTLQNKINELTLQRKKLTASISATRTKINATQLEIQKLANNIADTQTLIDHDAAGLGEGMRLMDASEREPLIVRVLDDTTLAEVWQDAEDVVTLGQALHDRILRLSNEKRELADTKTQRETKKAQLVDQQKTLTVQQGSLDAQKKSQDELLAQTKSQEATYQKIIATKKAQEAAFESALTNLKTKLDVAINPSQITTAGKDVLQWPVDDVRITQYFGNTEFAKNGGYNGKGHNGIDLAASIGTPIKSSLSGTVLAIGNTDSIKGCYSFGKWVMVKHPNGLNTMYAHLSSISVSQGQEVSTGQLLGYSGETGYATGPHLHFGVYVSSATKIMKLGDATNSKTPCAGATMPIVPLQGYLNPMSYL